MDASKFKHLNQYINSEKVPLIDSHESPVVDNQLTVPISNRKPLNNKIASSRSVNPENKKIS